MVDIIGFAAVKKNNGVYCFPCLFGRNNKDQNKCEKYKSTDRIIKQETPKACVKNAVNLSLFWKLNIARQ